LGEVERSDRTPATTTRKEEIMSATWQASGVVLTIALFLSSVGLGCGGNVTADDQNRFDDGTTGDERRADLDLDRRDRIGADREDADRDAASPKHESFFDRLLGARTRQVTVPAGTTVFLRWSESLSSRANSAGDAFRTTVDEDVRIADAVAIPSGSVVVGRVTEAHQPQKVGGRARLAVQFTEVELPSGESAPIEAVFTRSGKSQNGKDAAIIAGSTVGGAILGEAVHEGEGGVVGGILGGIGGAVAASRNKARPVEIPAGTVMAIELVRPVTLEVPA
jgi:hypothetical protein